MRIPQLGPRGEGWAVAQLALAALILLAGIEGPRWATTASTLRSIAGAVIGIAGLAVFIAGVAGLGSSLTPFPKPGAKATLRTSGVYRLVRHPIYGGSLLVALGWSLVSSPFALFVAACLAALFELKSRLEESLLTARFPEYVAYRRRVRWRFVPWVR
jgi:protein-S-isoprenylcysteine O-methyltransferase Ste14